MTARRLELPDGRTLVLDHLRAQRSPPVEVPFAVLAPAFGLEERQAVLAVACSLTERGCVEICLVGPDAEELHDLVDHALEARGLIDVVTTWHTADADACEHFRYGAGGGRVSLLALVASRPRLVGLLAAGAVDT